jgi:hypothetical protein
MSTREEFEKWHKSEYQGHNSYDYKHDTTAYIDDYVEMAWQAWQAAMESQATINPVAQISTDKDSFKYVEWLVDSPMQHFCYGTKFYTSPQPQASEPVAWRNPNDNHSASAFMWQQSATHSKPLYTSPPNTPYDVGKSYAQLADRLQAKLDKAREALKLYARRGWETGWEHAVQTLKEIE